MLLDDVPRVHVAVRIRPKLSSAANEIHTAERYESVACIPTSDTTLRLCSRSPNKEGQPQSFAYDRVFDADTTQEELYDGAAVAAVDRVLAGSNASLLTYGQTGSGKSHTVLGRTNVMGQSRDASSAAGVALDEDAGVLLRSVHDMLSFAQAMEQRQERRVLIGISAVEIYMEEVRDLLCTESSDSPIIQPVVVRDVVRLPRLRSLPITSLHEALTAFQSVISRRVQRSTSANDASSRSHAIFFLDVFQMPHSTAAPPPTLQQCLKMREGHLAALSDSRYRHRAIPTTPFGGASHLILGTCEMPVMHSRLTVADLAGSEKAKHSGARGVALDELCRINASLSALGNVVRGLHAGAAHVPYRDSKLTVVLCDAFSAPDAHISLVVNVSPTILTAEETLSSLYFADKMKRIPTQNTTLAPREAALQAGYLSTLQTFDAIVADMHIFHCQHEIPRPLLQSTTRPATSPLTERQLHISVMPVAERANQLALLCAERRQEWKSKARSAASTASDATSQLVTQDIQRRSLAIVQSFQQQRQAAMTAVAAVEAAAAVQRGSLQEMEAAMRRALLAEKQEISAAQKRRVALQALLHQRRGELTAVKEEWRRLSDEVDLLLLNGAAATDAVAAEAVEPSVDDLEAAQVVSHLASAAAESAALREELICLRRGNQRLSEQTSEGAETATAAAASLVSSRTDLYATNPSIEQLLQRISLASSGDPAAAKAGNAEAHLAKETHRPAQTSVLREIVNEAHRTIVPKYWNIQKAAGALPVSSDAAGGAAPPQRQRRRSHFDDAALVKRVLSFVDMGSTFYYVDDDGRLHQRLFYVSGVEGRAAARLCWDRRSRGVSLSTSSYVELTAVTRLIIGQSSPAFSKYRTRGKDVKGTFYTSFSVQYRSGSGKGSRQRSLDLICSSMQEMETWLIGLSELCHLTPSFADTYDVEEAMKGDDQQRTKIAAKSPGEAASAKAILSDSELQLSRRWHIPFNILVEVREEIQSRRARRERQVLYFTPGQLRELTGLDIFRASALWLYFRDAGCVANPLSHLFCYVEATETTLMLSTAAESRESSLPFGSNGRGGSMEEAMTTEERSNSCTSLPQSQSPALVSPSPSVEVAAVE